MNDAGARGFPLSALQQGMLFHWLLDRHSGTDIEQVVGELDEDIDARRLGEAWQETLGHFGALRTSFEWIGIQSPSQRVQEQASLPFTTVDLRDLSAAEAEGRFAEYLRSDRREGFDLHHAPLMRVALFRFGPARFRMVWSFHHILVDGRSFELVLNDVFERYAGEAGGSVPDRPFADYVAWVEQQDREASREFWRRRLAGFSATTPIPHDEHGRENAGTFSVVSATLSTDVTGRLRTLADSHNLSLNVLLMGAWALLLSRYSGEDDVVFGATKTTRRGSIPGADAMVGLFLATIPVRVPVTGALPASEWLRGLRAEWVGLRGHEHLPIVDIRQVTALPAGTPLFDSLVVFENYQFGTRLAGQGGAWAHRRFYILEQTGLPLTLLGYGDDALVLKLEHECGRIGHDTAERMLGHVTMILESWSEDLDRPLMATPMLSAAERRTILEEWNDTARPYPADVTIAELVERQVARTPSAPAVTFGNETIDYQALNARANQLARALVRHGAGPGVLVGISVERSIGMMVALLAIMKSGAAYLPLDPMFPRDRIAYMLDDSEARILVTQRSVAPSLPPFAGAVLEVDDPSWLHEDASNLGVAVDAGELAVVIYTSGSTGRPKGVQIPRRALLNLLWSMREWLALTQADRLLAVTTISFDIAGADIWLPWLVGAHTIVAPREAAADGEQLRTLITRHDITFLQATPITWRQLIEVGWDGKADLQGVCTGEAMPPEVAEHAVPLVGRMWNLYGPTETTIWSTGVQVPPGSRRISIGRPIANTRCYILDPAGQPVPAGVAGELYIAGDGLARGYLKRPDLDAEKFVPDPFVADGAARMYRTGDIARHLGDGVIECLGRTDHQVKIRGFRIELGEIESVLQRHPEVRQAVVVAREDAPGDKRLVAYVVRDRDGADAAALRAHLRSSLPDYMVPAAIVNLDAIPLTANGKIDRRALPAPDAGASLAPASRVTARTHVERQLSEIWEDLFGVADVGVHDNYFDLGGHSILAVKMISRISRVFGKQLPLNALFESPTIAQLAVHIEDAGRTVGPHSLVSIQSMGSRPPIFWIPGGAALGLFRLHNIVTRLGPDQPVYGLGSNAPESLDDVESVEERSAHYLELVRRVQPHGPYCFAGFCAGGRVAYEMAQQLAAVGEPVAFVGLINTSYPRYPSRWSDKVAIRLQRLLHRLRDARGRGLGPIALVRAKLGKRRAAREALPALAQSEDQVSQSGVEARAQARLEALLERTNMVFERYRPGVYQGTLTLFISGDEAYAGLGKRYDSRYRWLGHAANVEIREFSGGHLDLFGKRDSAHFADALMTAMDAALARNGVLWHP